MFDQCVVQYIVVYSIVSGIVYIYIYIYMNFTYLFRLQYIYYIYYLLLYIYIIIQTKFGIQPGDETAIRNLVTSYLEGLYWILTYYHKGCQSWNWFYPYLYAPLASDLINLASINVTFSKGKPFTPLLQLLSVLPPQSGNSFFNSYFYYYIYYYIMYILLHIHILYT